MKSLYKIIFSTSLSLGALGVSNADQINYPERTIRFIVPFAAGGGTDILARKIAADISVELNTPVIIENKPGASGVIGVTNVIRAKNDGYTFLFTHSTTLIQHPLTLLTPTYNPKTDLLPVVELSRGQQVMVVNPSLPVSNLNEYVQYAKQLGDKASFASWGQGTVAHYAGDYLNQIAKLKMLHVPYSGTAPVVQSVIGNEVPMGFIDPASARAQVAAGTLKAIAVAGETRSPALPDTPTFKEQGMPEMSPFGGWIGIFAPVNTPNSIIQVVADAAIKVVNEASTQSWMNERGFVPTGISYAEVTQSMAKEIDLWEGIFDSIGVVKQ